jgi:TldD protein
MNQSIDYHAVLRRALSRGGEYADIFIEKTSPLSVVLEDNRIERVVAGRESGVGLRLIFGHHTAYAYTNELTTAAALELADAVRSAASGPSIGSAITIHLERARPVSTVVKIPPERVPIEEKVGLVTRANRVAQSHDNRIRQVLVSYRENRQQVLIANSDGTLIEDDRTYITAMVHVVAAGAGGDVQTGYEAVGGLSGLELFEPEAFEVAAETAARRAVMMLSARKAPAGKMPVVLSSAAGGTMIHEAVGHGLEADLAQAGLSVYSDMLGKQIASPLITVLDDSTLAGRRGSFSCDDEGVPAQRTVLVEGGVLRTYLYDRLTAMKDGTRSTGNGRRESYRSRPIPRMTNTMIAPGGSRPGDILRSTDRGLFVTKMGGGQVNTVNGDFVFEVSEGYLIENGKVGEPVRGASLIGNGPAVLRSIDLVGSDLGFSIGTCGKDGQGAPVSDAQPTLRIPEITVGGEVAD